MHCTETRTVLKNRTTKVVSSNQYQRLACCSVTHTYFWSTLRILFTVFLETKTQNSKIRELWKLMWAILGWQQWQPLASVPEQNLKNTLYKRCLYGWGFHAKNVFFFNICNVQCWLGLGCLDYKPLLDLSTYWSDSCRRYNLKGVLWCVYGDMLS